MHLKQRAVVIDLRRLLPRNLVHLAADVRDLTLRRQNLNVAIKTADLHLAQIVQRRRHNLRNVRARLQIRRVVRNNKVLRRHKPADNAVHRDIKIRLLERRTGQRQHEQHLVHVRSVFLHRVRDVIVHEHLDAASLLNLGPRLLAQNSSLDRTRRRQKLIKRLRLKLRGSLGQQRVRHTRSTPERLSALNVIETQKVQTVRVSVRPLLTRSLVRVKLRQQLARNPRKLALRHLFRQVGPKLVLLAALVLRVKVYLNTAVVQLGNRNVRTVLAKRLIRQIRVHRVRKLQLNLRRKVLLSHLRGHVTIHQSAVLSHGSSLILRVKVPAGVPGKIKIRPVRRTGGVVRNPRGTRAIFRRTRHNAVQLPENRIIYHLRQLLC